MQQYRHTMIVTTVATDATRDTIGNYVQADNDTTLLLPCRAEPSSGYRYITAADGAQINYVFSVYMPLSTPDIEVGAQVDIRDISQQVAAYTGIENEPVEIALTADMAGTNIVPFPALKGATYRLERLGYGTVGKSQYTYLQDGGFAFIDPQTQVREGETFFAYITGNNVTADIASARMVASGTVKEFVRNLFNVKLWL